MTTTASKLLRRGKAKLEGPPNIGPLVALEKRAGSVNCLGCTILNTQLAYHASGRSVK